MKVEGTMTSPGRRACRVTQFDEFLERLQRADYGALAPRDSHRRSPGREREFERRKAYLRDRYEGLNVLHSFTDSAGRVFDCVKPEDQPALRRSGLKLATPRDLPVTDGRRAQRSTSTLPTFAPEGAVPIRRITPADLMRYKSLDSFLRKPAQRSVAIPEEASASAQSAAATRYHTHAEQTIDNIGVCTILNVWQPPVTGSEIFSLSQLWINADSSQGTQTAEVGWQVSPFLNGTDKPVLFTYWTRDGYASSTLNGYSNRDGNFVVSSSSCPIDMPIDDISIFGGQQAELEVGYLLHEGNWWLYVGGTDAAHAVGYYPASIYGPDGLGVGGAGIDFGGETLSLTTAPPMGSGKFAAAGVGQAAYQRNVVYFDTNSVQNSAALTPQGDQPGMYSLQMGGDASWGTCFMFGGPGDDVASIGG